MNLKVIYPPDGMTAPAKYNKLREYQYEAKAETPKEACEEVFREFNHVNGQEYIATAGLQERSFSVGDMVEINGDVYLCQFVGFKQIDKAKKDEFINMDFAKRQLETYRLK